MNGGVAAGRPARAKRDAGGMGPAADEKLSGYARGRRLSMAPQAQIRIRFQQRFGIDGAMRVVTGRAAFAQGRVFVNERLGLLLVALGARFIQPRHGQPPFRLHDVHAVGIVAIHAIHFAFQYGMMIRKMKLRFDVRVAAKTCLRVFPRVDDEFFQAALARHRDVFAARAVAGFAAVLAGHCALGFMQPRMDAGWKNACDVLMTIRAGRIPHIRRAFDLRRDEARPAADGTRIEQQNKRADTRKEYQRGKPAETDDFEKTRQGFGWRTTT